MCTLVFAQMFGKPKILHKINSFVASPVVGDRIFAILLLKPEGEVREKVEESFRNDRGYLSAARPQLKLLKSLNSLVPEAHAGGITALILEGLRILPIGLPS